MANGELDHDSCEAAASTEGASHDIMSPKEKQAAAQQTFVFLGPLTNEPPATAGNGVRQHGVRESMLESKRKTSGCAADMEVYLFADGRREKMYYYLPTGEKRNSEINQLLNELQKYGAINADDHVKLSDIMSKLLLAYEELSKPGVEVKPEWTEALREWKQFAGIDANVKSFTKDDLRREIEKTWHTLAVYDNFDIQESLQEFCRKTEEKQGLLPRYEQRLHGRDMHGLLVLKLRNASDAGDISEALDGLLVQSARLKEDEAELGRRKKFCIKAIKKMERALGYKEELPKDMKLETAEDFRKYVEARRTSICHWLTDEKNTDMSKLRKACGEYKSADGKREKTELPDISRAESFINEFVTAEIAREKEEKAAAEAAANAASARAKREEKDRIKREADKEEANDKTRRFFCNDENGKSGLWNQSEYIPKMPMPRTHKTIWGAIDEITDTFKKAKEEGRFKYHDHFNPACLYDLLDQHNDPDKSGSYTDLYRVYNAFGLTENYECKFGRFRDAAEGMFPIATRSKEDFNKKVEFLWTYINELKKFSDKGMMLTDASPELLSDWDYNYPDNFEKKKQNNYFEWFWKYTEKFYNEKTPIDDKTKDGKYRYPVQMKKAAEFEKAVKEEEAEREIDRQRRLEEAKQEEKRRAERKAEAARKAVEKQKEESRKEREQIAANASSADDYVKAVSEEFVDDLLTEAKRDTIQEAFESIKDSTVWFGHKKEFNAMKESVDAYLALKEKLNEQEADYKLNDEEKQIAQNAYNACREYLKNHLKEGEVQSIGGQGGDTGRLRKQAVVNMLECMESLPEFKNAAENYKKAAGKESKESSRSKLNFKQLRESLEDKTKIKNDAKATKGYGELMKANKDNRKLKLEKPEPSKIKRSNTLG